MEILIKLKTDDLTVGDKLVQKMLRSLSPDELELFEDCKLSLTMITIERDPDDKELDLS